MPTPSDTEGDTKTVPDRPRFFPLSPAAIRALRAGDT